MGYTGVFTELSAESYIRKELTHGIYTPVANKGAGSWVVLNNETGKRFAVVVLAKKDRYGYLTYKIIHETSGPAQDTFPLSLLNQLDPIDSEWANDWRERVRAYHRNKASKPHLTPGDVVRFEKPISFTGGFDASELTYLGGFRFETGRFGSRVRLPRDWKTRFEWEVVTA